jgi:hypothetical protein
MTTFTLKTESLYCACSPELGVVSYGQCRDEAVNNLEDEVRVLAGEAGEDESPRWLSLAARPGQP